MNYSEFGISIVELQSPDCRTECGSGQLRRDIKILELEFGKHQNAPITNLEYTHIKYHLLYKPIKTRENSYLDINIQNFGTELFGSLEPKN